MINKKHNGFVPKQKSNSTKAELFNNNNNNNNNDNNNNSFSLNYNKSIPLNVVNFIDSIDEHPLNDEIDMNMTLEVEALSDHIKSSQQPITNPIRMGTVHSTSSHKTEVPHLVQKIDKTESYCMEDLLAAEAAMYNVKR